MEKQKVISVNINTRAIGDAGYKEFEIEEVNKYLDQGYFVKDKISIVSNGDSAFVNLTFILEKP